MFFSSYFLLDEIHFKILKHEVMYLSYKKMLFARKYFISANLHIYEFVPYLSISRLLYLKKNSLIIGKKVKFLLYLSKLNLNFNN